MLLTIQHHCEQEWPNSCVPACIGIVLRGRGQGFDEAALHADASRSGHGLGLAVEVLGGVRCVLSPEEFLAQRPSGWPMAGS